MIHINIYEGEATIENVIECFLDYVDSGAFGSIDYEEAKQEIEDGEITIDQICKDMLRVCKKFKYYSFIMIRLQSMQGGL
ncbi:hypothetical protein OKW24_002635 [Peribacillus simplex]|uniref:hypothetical protein n=1 Tax=Peribacillus simplex TaxID=1478 RepID=UPI0024E19D16|nr:hypothetical protein [Peribacillus simplex]MDF9760862.1 hypothetical protein [Peribacillus simplex]